MIYEFMIFMYKCILIFSYGPNECTNILSRENGNHLPGAITFNTT